MILPLALTLAPALVPVSVLEPTAPRPSVGTPVAAEHTALHPAGCTFYMEMPALAPLLAGYDQAPLLRMLADSGVREAMAGFGVEADALQLGPAIQNGLAQLLGGPENVGLLSDIAALSMSVSMDPTAAPSPDSAGMQLVVDYGSADNATKAQAMVPMLVQSIAGMGSQLGELSGQGDLGAMAGGWQDAVWSSVEGGRLFVGAGTCTQDGLRQRAEQANGLASDELMKSVGAKLGKVSGSSWDDAGGLAIVRDFMRTSPMAGPLASAPSSATALLRAIDPLPGPTCFRMRLDGGRFHTETFTATDEDPKVFGVQPLSTEWLGLIPSEVMFAYGGTMDGAAFGELLLSVLGDAGLGDEQKAMAEEAVKVLSQLGPNMVMYAEPLAGPSVPKSFLWAELADAEGFQDKLSGTLERMLTPRGGSVSTRDYKVKDKASGERIPFPITTIKLPEDPGGDPMGGMSPMPVKVSPAFTVVNGKFLGAASGTHIKRELKRMFSGDAQPDGAGAFAAASLPSDARSAAMMNWSALIDSVMGMVKAFGGLAAAAAGPEGLPFDPSALPDPQIFTSFFDPTMHVTRRVEGGLYRSHTASFGPETWLGMVAAGFAAYREAVAAGVLPE